MAVELLYSEGCPHAAEYLPHLQELVAAGVDDRVQTQLIQSMRPAVM
jgi:hypothetical protein